MSKILNIPACLALLVFLSACQGPASEADGTAATEPAITAAEAAHEEAAPESDEGPSQLEQFMALGRLDAERGLLGKTDAATPGYVFFNPLKSDTVYLVDRDGQVVHTWKSDYGISGGMYFKDNGNLFRAGRDPAARVFAGGGQGGLFQELTWDGEVVWQYTFHSEKYLPHHDVALLPNGNFLAIAWEAKTVEESIALGRDPEQISPTGMWPDWVIEFRPIGSDDAEIVWEWHLWDHVVQDFDETKANYGVVADHPELLDINAGHLPDPITEEEMVQRKAMDLASTNKSVANWGADVYHMNAIDYNANLDQIALSLPGISEIFIIDHSTTTEEAAGHSGGRWGKGGDILYRWGNPANYGRGEEGDQQLGDQHDVRWIPPGFPGAGNLTVFNNNAHGVGPAKSAVIELATPLMESGYALNDSAPFGPAAPVWQYLADAPMQFFSPFISGAHRLSNGHTMVTEGASGRYFEVDADGNVVWNYMTPYAGDLVMPDGTSPQPIGPLIYATFRAVHVPADHPALAGRDLKPLDPQPPIVLPPPRTPPPD